jgi:hypothetical protein
MRSSKSLFTLSLLGRNIFSNTKFPNTINLCFSLKGRDQASHPYKERKNYSPVFRDLYIFR